MVKKISIGPDWWSVAIDILASFMCVELNKEIFVYNECFNLLVLVLVEWGFYAIPKLTILV